MSPRKRDASAPGDPAAVPAAAPPLVGPDGRPLTFEQALERLETIVEQLEDGKLPLEQSIERFEEGVVLSRFLEGELGRAEKRVQELVDRAGAPGTRPWAEDDLAETGEDLLDDDEAL